MVIYLKNPQTDAAVRLLAQRTGRSLTEAIDDAVREKLARLDPQEPGTPASEAFDAAIARVRAWGRGITNPDDLYDEDGLPR